MKFTLKLKNVSAYLSILFLTLVITSCNPDNEEVDAAEEVVSTETDLNFIATDWTNATHSKDADPNFTEVFSNTEVKRLDIVITKDRWQSMLDDMTKLYGTFGTRSAGGGFSSENPIFVPAEVFYKGKEWYRVGVRFKGNSSLASTWGSGNLKLSFKLDFDEFEDTYPQIKNQRFYGFKKLSLKNNFDDKSMLREKVAAEIFNLNYSLGFKMLI